MICEFRPLPQEKPFFSSPDDPRTRILLPPLSFPWKWKSVRFSFPSLRDGRVFPPAPVISFPSPSSLLARPFFLLSHKRCRFLRRTYLQGAPDRSPKDPHFPPFTCSPFQWLPSSLPGVWLGDPLFFARYFPSSEPFLSCCFSPPFLFVPPNALCPRRFFPPPPLCR